MDEQVTHKLLSLQGVACIALVIGGLSLAFWGTESAPIGRPIADGKQVTSLAMEYYSIDLGDVLPRPTIPVLFRFWNRGETPLEIVQIKPSCGCMKARLAGGKQVYQPGEAGQFTVEVDITKEAPGRQQYAVQVNYKDEAAHAEQLMFRMTIPERKVTVNPPELWFYSSSGDPLSSQIMIEDHRGKELKVLDVEVHSSQRAAAPLKVEIGDRKTIKAGVTGVPIKVVSADRVPPGEQTVLLKIRTDDEEFPVLAVPVFLYGPQPGVQLTSGETVAPEKPPERKQPASEEDDRDSGTVTLPKELPPHASGLDLTLPETPQTAEERPIIQSQQERARRLKQESEVRTADGGQSREQQ